MLFEELEADIQVIGDDIWVALNHVPDEFAPNTIIPCSYNRKSREISIQVLLLYISYTECHKYK
jgi:hypothetical protein